MDSPQTSSYCPFGKWMNRETLILSLNVSTKQLALWVKLQVLHIKAVHRDRVSFHGSPFESSTFYYVTQKQSNVCLAWLLYSINASWNTHTWKEKAPLPKETDHFQEAKNSKWEAAVRGGPGGSQHKWLISFIHWYRPIKKYNYKSKHTFDERKQHRWHKKICHFPNA
jgi:hypothetical protein